MYHCISPDGTDGTDGSISPDIVELNLTEYDLKRLGVNEDETTHKKQRAGNSQTLVAEALQSMSMAERERVFDDIHGVDKHAEESEALETPPFLEKQLHIFEEELRLFKLLKDGNQEMQALEIAEQQNPAFVQDPRLRLAFLRTRDWNASEAVAAFVRHFDFKHHLFGTKLLTRIVGTHHLSSHDKHELSKGYVQVLPNRDRAGRAIMVWVNVGQEYESIESMARQLYVMIPVDLETQRRGVCFVSIRIKPYTFKTQSTIELNKTVARSLYDMPLRAAAHHSCMLVSALPDVPLEQFLKSAVPIHTTKNQARMRFHYGSFIEWCYALSTFGIPSHLLPLTNDMSIKLKNHQEYLDMHARATSLHYEDQAILLPTNRDLLLGKGKPIQQSPGNVMWGEFLEVLLMAQADLSTHRMYTALAKQVIERVHKHRGRILTKDSGVWELVPDEVAQEKIAGMMRNRRFRQKHRTK